MKVGTYYRPQRNKKDYVKTIIEQKNMGKLDRTAF